LRPIELHMTAFGPYKDTETIDFTKLHKRQLFVISGATGSGKTTIFDAICFALYGSASGTDRDNNRMLRSQFADDATYTAVDFTFSLREKTYRVFRQLPHIREGNRTETGAKYELYEIKENGEEIPAVDRQMVSEINEKVESLIGLTKEQFQQIMMLPQGEFMKLLTSDTENKEKILRRIFKTEKYERLNELIGERVRDLRQRYETERNVIDREIQSVRSLLDEEEENPLHAMLDEQNFTTAQFITEMENYDETLLTNVRTTKKAYDNARKAYRDKEQSLQRAKSINERFHALDEKKRLLAEREKLAETYEQKETTLQAAERARKVAPYETQYNDRKVELQEQEAALQTATIREKEALEAYERANELYEKEKANEPERQRLHVQIDRYTQLVPLVKEIDTTKEKITQCYEREKRLLKEMENLTEEHQSHERDLKKLNDDMSKKEETLKTRPEKESRLFHAERQLEIVERYESELDVCKQLHMSLQEAEEQLKRAESDLRTIEQTWYADQAAVLAASLQDGKPCPVCGSEHHPHLAERTEAHVTEPEVEQVRNTFHKKQSHYEKVRAEWMVAKGQVEKTSEQLRLLAIDEQNVAAYVKQTKEDVQTLKTTLAELEKMEESLKKERDCRTKLEQALQACEEQLAEKQHALNDLKVERSELEGKLRAEETHMPEDVTQLEELQQRIKAMEIKYNAIVTAWEESERKLREAADTFTAARTERKQIESYVTSLTERKERAKKQFLSRLDDASFDSIEAYKQVKRTEAEMEQLRSEIEAYKEERATLRAQIAALETELADATRYDLDVLTEEVRTLAKLYETTLQTWNEANDRQKKFHELTNELKALSAELEALEKEVATYTDLYDIIRGQNVKRISFERYLQMDYLEQIIAAANVRFHSLTNGQFTLMRSDRQESRGRQSGLAFDVHDTFTGQARDVKTLSGGEKFIASLCLALGMSDVIQQFQGGISMETIFIDEGFGNLDDESLQKAIDVLISLQKAGRMIGVISHVETIKSLFPARIEVSKTKAGYSKTTVMLT